MTKEEMVKDKKTITINKHYFEIDGEYYYNYDQMCIDFEEEIAKLRKKSLQEED